MISDKTAEQYEQMKIHLDNRWVMLLCNKPMALLIRGYIHFTDEVFTIANKQGGVVISTELITSIVQIRKIELVPKFKIVLDKQFQVTITLSPHK